MAAEYWIELSRDLAELPQTMEILDDCGLTVVSKSEADHHHDEAGLPCHLHGSVVVWRVSDPAAPEDLQDKTVMLGLQVFTTDPNASPPVQHYRIVERNPR